MLLDWQNQHCQPGCVITKNLQIQFHLHQHSKDIPLKKIIQKCIGKHKRPRILKTFLRREERENEKTRYVSTVSIDKYKTKLVIHR